MIDLKIPVLMYHRIAHDRSETRFTVSPVDFEQQVKLLRDQGYQGVSLDSLVSALDGVASLPSKAIVFTFDDGFQETIDYACPILKRFEFTATFFLVSGLMGRTNEWMKSEGYSSTALIGWSQARSLLVDGFTIGSHSVSHPILPEINLAIAKREIVESKQELEDRLAAPINLFAYPYGRLNSAIQKIVREAGYLAACSTQAGFNGLTVDRFALRRLDVFGTHSLRYFRRNLIFGENQMNINKLLAYYASRAISRIADLVS